MEGILVFWNNQVLSLLEPFPSPVVLKNCVNNFVWVFSGGYSLVQNEGGDEFWKKLRD